MNLNPTPGGFLIRFRIFPFFGVCFIICVTLALCEASSSGVDSAGPRRMNGLGRVTSGWEVGIMEMTVLFFGRILFFLFFLKL